MLVFAKVMVLVIATVGTVLGSFAGTVSSDLAADAGDGPVVGDGGLPDPGGLVPATPDLPAVPAVPDAPSAYGTRSAPQLPDVDAGDALGARADDDGCTAYVTTKESDETETDPDAFVDCDASHDGLEGDLDAYGGHDDGIGGDGSYSGPSAAGTSADRSFKKWVGWEDALPSP